MDNNLASSSTSGRPSLQEGDEREPSGAKPQLDSSIVTVPVPARCSACQEDEAPGSSASLADSETSMQVGRGGVSFSVHRSAGSSGTSAPFRAGSETSALNDTAQSTTTKATIGSSGRGSPFAGRLCSICRKDTNSLRRTASQSGLSRSTLAQSRSRKPGLGGVLRAKNAASLWRNRASQPERADSLSMNKTSMSDKAPRAKRGTTFGLGGPPVCMKGMAFAQQSVIEAPDQDVEVRELANAYRVATEKRADAKSPSASFDELGNASASADQGEVSALNKSCSGATFRETPLRRTSTMASADDTMDKMQQLMAVTHERMATGCIRAILPYGARKVMWDRLILLLSLYTAVAVPVIGGLLGRDEVPSAMLGVMWATDALFFFIDIPVAAHTAYVSRGGNLVLELTEIRARYARTWLALDLLASLPWDAACLDAAAAPLWVWRSTLAPRMLRLTKIYRHHVEYVMRFGNTAHENLRRVASLMLGLLLLCHMLGCLLCLLDGFPPSDLLAEDSPLLEDRRNDLGELYVISIFASMQLVFGEAGFTTSVRGRLLETFALAFGGLVVSLVYANMTHIVSQAGSRTAQHRERQQLTLETMRHLGLPEHQQQLVCSYFDYIWYRHNNFDGLGFLERLPETLRARISAKVHTTARTRRRLTSLRASAPPRPSLLHAVPLHRPCTAYAPLCTAYAKVHGDMVRRVPAFEGVPADVIALLCMQLRPQVYMPADTVCGLGSRAREMFFISKGTVTVHGAEGQVLRVLRSGDFFGELGLVRTPRHRMHSRAFVCTMRRACRVDAARARARARRPPHPRLV